jgi:tetratricopeptide (TPR) repeat protein
MSSMRVAVLVTLGLVLGLTSGAMAASPEKNKALAKQHFEAGVSHFDLAEWEQALVEFKEAYRLKSDASLLYNIAQCHRKLGHVDDALTFYKTYLRRAPEAPNREEVERRIQELEAEQPGRKAEARVPEAKPATLPAPPVEQRPVPSPLPTSVAGPAGPAAVSPASENRADLVQPAGSTQPEATSETSILHRWWFWTAVGVVVVGGVTAALLATRGNGSGPFCPDCAATWAVDAK